MAIFYSCWVLIKLVNRFGLNPCTKVTNGQKDFRSDLDYCGLKINSVVWYIIPSIVSYQKVVLVIWKLRRKKSLGSSIRCFFLLFSYSRRYLSFLINKARLLMPVWVNQEVDDLDYPSDRNRHWLTPKN